MSRETNVRDLDVEIEKKIIERHVGIILFYPGVQEKMHFSLS